MASIEPRPLRPPRTLIALARTGILIGAALTLLLPPLVWSDPAWVREAIVPAAGLGRTDPLIDSHVLVWGMVSSMLPIALALATLWQLWRLFGEYGQGRALGRCALGHLRRFAWLWLALVVAQPVLRSVWSVLLTLGNPPGQRMLAIQLQGADYMQLLVGAVLLAVAHVMHEAVLAAEENQAFV